LIYNVSARLNPGCYFVATVPNAYWIVKRLKEAMSNSFGNSLYKFEFEQKEKMTRFGCRYDFTLVESVDKCPEFLVHIPTLADIGKRYGLTLEKCAGSHEYYHENASKFQPLLQRMNVFNDKGTMTQEEWEAAGIYMVLVFKKNGEASAPYRSNALGGGGRRVSHDDIVIVK